MVLQSANKQDPYDGLKGEPKKIPPQSLHYTNLDKAVFLKALRSISKINFKVAQRLYLTRKLPQSFAVGKCHWRSIHKVV